MIKQNNQAYLTSPSGDLVHCQVEKTINGISITMGEEVFIFNKESALDLADMIILEISEDFDYE